MCILIRDSQDGLVHTYQLATLWYTWVHIVIVIFSPCNIVNTNIMCVVIARGWSQ